jgi:hypothetical protein
VDVMREAAREPRESGERAARERRESGERVRARGSCRDPAAAAARRLGLATYGCVWSARVNSRRGPSARRRPGVCVPRCEHGVACSSGRQA